MSRRPGVLCYGVGAVSQERSRPGGVIPRQSPLPTQQTLPKNCQALRLKKKSAALIPRNFHARIHQQSWQEILRNLVF